MQQQTNESKTMNVVIYCKIDWEITNKENKRKIKTLQLNFFQNNKKKKNI